MLFRRDGEDVIAITQPSHCWLSGQLVRAWGNAGFAAPSPYEEVCLGAELHDIGWLSWEAAPTLDPATGRPHDFRAVRTAAHIALWREGVRHALAFGRYPALLVSLHANTIFGAYFDPARASPEDKARVAAFLAEQREFQEAGRASLAAQPRYAEAVTAAAVERNRRLVAASDRLSLEICWGVDGERTIPDVPTRGADHSPLRLAASTGNPAELSLDPWPFGTDRVEVVCEGRRLAGRFSEEPAMREALAAAAPISITARLRRL